MFFITFSPSGIQKKKRGRMLYDEVAKEWKPRYGYKKAGSDKEQNWVVEVRTVLLLLVIYCCPL